MSGLAIVTPDEAPVADGEARWRRAAEAALTLGESRWLVRLCETMRAARPHHIEARYYQARLAMRGGDWRRATPLLEAILASDPEHWPARWALGALLIERGRSEAGLARCHEAAHMGGRQIEAILRETLPPELRDLAPPPSTRPGVSQEIWDEAYHQLTSVLGEPDASLPAELMDGQLQDAMVLARLWALDARDRARRFAEKMVRVYPRMVRPRLLLAAAHAERGHHAESVARLHDARALDPGGTVAGRLALPMLTMAQSTALPDEVEQVLAQLPVALRRLVDRESGLQSPAPIALPATHAKRRGAEGTAPSATLQEIQRELSRLQVQVDNHMPRVERRRLATAEVILTAREPLVRLYGAEGADRVLVALRSLVATIEQGVEVRPHLVLLDDPATLAPWKLDPVDPTNAGLIKSLIDELETRMERAGDRLSYLLIVGGHDIIPHHRLPNPVDDDDMDVPSDNPYAARGENYLIPTRAVGRLPHERGSPDLLVTQLERLRRRWRDRVTQGKGLLDLWFARWLGKLPLQVLPSGDSWGMTAEVWARAAAEVYRTLDRRSELVISPPMNAGELDPGSVPDSPFLYFNLHGLENSPSWYGQASPDRASDESAFPVALTPALLAERDLDGSVLFTECCYGIKPRARRAGDSIALTAVRSGCAIVVGSTKTAYASFAPPLMAADLLAALFWKAIAGGAPGGLALQRAKIQLAEMMMRRTGYLDVEEQKTLTSFVLYGDPALPLSRQPRNGDPDALRELVAKTRRKGLYQVGGKGVAREALAPEMLERVQSFARPYLQGVGGALDVRTTPVTLTQTPPPLVGSHALAPHAKRLPRGGSRWHLTFSRIEEQDGVRHPRYLTMTVNLQGKILQSHHSR